VGGTARAASDRSKELGNKCLSSGDLGAAERHYSERCDWFSPLLLPAFELPAFRIAPWLFTAIFDACPSSRFQSCFRLSCVCVGCSLSLRLDPTNWAAQNNRALCRLKQQQWLGAAADATAVLEPHAALRRSTHAHTHSTLRAICSMSTLHKTRPPSRTPHTYTLARTLTRRFRFF
jgi:hypothetical protein